MVQHFYPAVRTYSTFSDIPSFHATQTLMNFTGNAIIAYSRVNQTLTFFLR